VIRQDAVVAVCRFFFDCHPPPALRKIEPAPPDHPRSNRCLSSTACSNSLGTEGYCFYPIDPYRVREYNGKYMVENFFPGVFAANATLLQQSHLTFFKSI